MKIVLSFLLLFTSLVAFDITKVELSSHTVVNGGSILLEFSPQKNIEYLHVDSANKSFKITPHPLDKKKSFTLVPFDYYEKAQNKTLKILYRENAALKSEEFLVKVVDGKYAKEEIHVSSEKVNPQSKAVQERISREYSEAMKIYGHITPKSYIASAFIMPIESKITSDFGKARTYNGSLKGYHSGTDFRAAVGTPIVAANDGVVALVDDRFYSGGTVLLDHGLGIYTCYFHMSKYHVKKGEFVKKGDSLGLSGQSGRVTGPHLHFAARINGVQVDPLGLIELINKNLLQGKQSL